MLDGPGQQPDDRRGGYSFRKHFARLKREKRLARIGVGALAVLVVGGITFARCQSSGITGPSTASAPNSNAPSLHESSPGGLGGVPGDALTFKEKTVQHDVVFVGFNPCNDDEIEARGTRYESLRVTAGTGYFDSHSRIQDYFKGYSVSDGPLDRPIRYKGQNEVEHDSRITLTSGIDDEKEVEEDLISQGSQNPDFKLRVFMRVRVRPGDDPFNARQITYRARATCSVEKCRKSGGCGDRDCETRETKIFDIPQMPTVLPQ
jgi:hypothetical protein